MNGVELRLLGQQLVERTWIPTYNQMLSVPVIIESREQAEQTAIELEGHPGRCIWTDASRDDQGNVGAAAVWRQDTEWAGLEFRLG
jgi:hypothetical protein